jgi:hypothetical protein
MGSFKESILVDIESSKAILSEMITRANKQGAKNIGMLSTLNQGLNELTEVLKDKKVNQDFLKKWNSIMGWAPKVFEEHPLLDLLRNIDNMLMTGKV